jgi:hypothetical protein
MLVATTLSLKMVAYPVAVLDKLLSPISVPMRESTVYIINWETETNFSVDQLSQALELTSSDETSLEGKRY